MSDSEWSDWNDILNHYETISMNIPYREYMPKPVKKNTESNASFGKRLDDYEELKHAKNLKDRENSRIRAEVYDEMEHEIFKFFELDWENVKARKAWNIAYEEGHSNGYGEVLNYFEKLVELIK